MGNSGGVCFCSRISKNHNINKEETQIHISSPPQSKTKKVLIVFAHPEPRSLNGHLREIAVKSLTELGYNVTVSDLYADKFKPVIEKSDFPFYKETNFSVEEANAMACKLDILPDDVRQEKKRLEEADLIIFQFPMWRFTCPSMLHAYFERVLLPGWAYSTDKPALKGKKALICTSTGKKEEDYTTKRCGTIKQVYHHLIVGTLGFVGIQVLEPFVIYNVFGLSRIEKEEKFKLYEDAIKNIEIRPLV